MGIPPEDDWAGAAAGVGHFSGLSLRQENTASCSDLERPVSPWVCAQGSKAPHRIYVEFGWGLRHSVLCQACASSLPLQHFGSSLGWHSTDPVHQRLHPGLPEGEICWPSHRCPARHGIISGSQVQDNIHYCRKSEGNQVQSHIGDGDRGIAVWPGHSRVSCFIASWNSLRTRATKKEDPRKFLQKGNNIFCHSYTITQRADGKQSCLPTCSLLALTVNQIPCIGGRTTRKCSQTWKNWQKKYLCVPATSSPSEKVFSTSGNVVTCHWTSLKKKPWTDLCFWHKTSRQRFPLIACLKHKQTINTHIPTPPVMWLLLFRVVSQSQPGLLLLWFPHNANFILLF